MKNKLVIIFLFIISCFFIGCVSHQPTLYTEANNGKLIIVTINQRVDQKTKQEILNYIKNDADKHYASNNNPYKFNPKRN